MRGWQRNRRRNTEERSNKRARRGGVRGQPHSPDDGKPHHFFSLYEDRLVSGTADDSHNSNLTAKESELRHTHTHREGGRHGSFSVTNSAGY